MKKVVHGLCMDRDTGVVDMVKIGVIFSIDDGMEGMTINIGSLSIGFRYEEIQEMIRQERMRNG